MRAQIKRKMGTFIFQIKTFIMNQIVHIICTLFHTIIWGRGTLLFGGEIDTPPQLLRTFPIIRLVKCSGRDRLSRAYRCYTWK